MPKKLYECTTVVRYYAEADSATEARALLPRVLDSEKHAWADFAFEVPPKTVFSAEDKDAYPVYAQQEPYRNLGEVMDTDQQTPRASKNDAWY